MTLSISARRKAAWILVLLAVLLVIAGCAGIQPYKPRNHREEGPERGLASGSEGEFVIFRKADKPKTGSEASKSSDETADGEQQKTGSEEREKKAETKSSEQQP